MRKSSPRLRFVIFAAVAVIVPLALWLVKSAETPPWGDATEANAGQTATASKSTKSSRAELTPFSFVSYNVKNWLTSTQSPEKSIEAKQVIVRILSDCKADVIGLCEIGSESDLSGIQSMLKNAGTDLPYSYHTGGVDKIRHLGILSRFPIISKKNPETKIPGTEYSMQRGILDVTIEIDSIPVRFIGLHLKSKRIVPHFDQELLRIEEAQHVRNHIDRILTEDPSTLLVVHGDFNDHIRSMSTRTILGTYRTPLYLSPVHVEDSRGENWTHFFDAQDSYSRIDFVTVSSKLRPHVDRKHSKVIDDPSWNIGSDHRPVFVSFK